MILGMVAMSVEQFEELVANAFDGIPAELGVAMENVAVMVDDHSPPGRLLGRYQGVPLTSRGAHYSAITPDRITIFMATICDVPDGARSCRGSSPRGDPRGRASLRYR